MFGKTPWVDTTMRSFWERVSAVVPKPEWMPLLVPGKRRLSVQEYGCGHYGCVMPTGDDNVVFKITSDKAEAFFVSAAMKIGKMPDGIVRYYAIYGLPGVSRQGRPLFVLWREKATEVGLRVYHYKYRFGSYLGRFLAFASIVRDSLKRSTNPVLLLTEAKRHENFAARVVSDLDIDNYAAAHEAVSVAARHRGAQKVAISLQLCRVVAERMLTVDGAEYVADALLFYLDEGLLLADVHAGNVGTVKRAVGWVIVDPGHAVVVDPARWSDLEVPTIP